MALIKCPECSKEVSDKASNCPNCGILLNNTKYCMHCGQCIDKDCVICPKCGKQVSKLFGDSSDKNIIINNSSSASAAAVNIGGQQGRLKDKWVALLLCIFFGYFGVHKFYEGRMGLGILYLITLGIFGFGWIIDIIILILKPNPYYVY